MSKTKPRPIPIIYSIPYLSQWLNNHPNRDNPNASLFVRLYKGKYGQYTTTGLYLIIKNIAKCLNKEIYPHLFRHSRLTELAKHLTEAELCKFAGWVIGSKQARRYVHLAHEDVENKKQQEYKGQDLSGGGEVPPETSGQPSSGALGGIGDIAQKYFQQFMQNMGR